MNVRQNGFTLLELMVAMGILAVLAAVAYGGLNVILRDHEATSESLAELATLQRTISLLSSDFAQMQPRSVREEFHGERDAAMKAGPQHVYGIEFTRGGWSNPGQARRATLQRVAWHLNDGRVERHHWQVLDRAAMSPAVVTELAGGVREVRWRFLDRTGEWQEFWPPLRELQPDPDALPEAVEVVFEFLNGDTLSRVFVTGAR